MNVVIADGSIHVHLTGVSDTAQMWCGLYCDHELVDQQEHTGGNGVRFALRKNAVYQVTVREKKATGGEEQSISSEPFRYIKGRKPDHIPFVHIDAMEMTNHCNLACDNCCTPTSKYPKGFIDDHTVLAALAWVQKGQTLDYNRQGEPLLHRELEKYLRWGVEAGVRPMLSTNGLLLDKDRLAALYKSGLRRLVISLHVPEALDRFLQVLEYLDAHTSDLRHFGGFREPGTGDAMFFAGRVLDFQDDVQQSKDVRDMLGLLPDKAKRFLQVMRTHTWAGNVPDTQRTNPKDVVSYKQSRCRFITNRKVNMRWDGTIVGCCFDSENENELGHISDFSGIRIDLEKYKLCRHCDDNWAT